MRTRKSCPFRVASVTAGVLSLWAAAPAGADDPNAPPEIVQQPVSQAVCEGEDVVFEVVATGPELSYQWRKDSIPIDGATNATLECPAVEPADAGGYDVVVSNANGSVTSDAAALTVDTGPVIAEHPADQSVCAGEPVTLSVLATGLDLAYQWRKDDDPIPGATNDTFLLDSAGVEDSGDYDVVVTNPCGAGVAYSEVATVVVDPGPEILEHPASQEVCEGDAVTLTVTVGGEATSYEDEVGSLASSGSGARMRGNYYRVDDGTTLTRIEHYLSISQSGVIVFFVYEADNLSGPYALIAQDTVSDSGTGSGYYGSNPMAVPLAAGRYYIIGAAWPAEHTYYWNSSHPNTTSFGVSLNGFAYAYQDPLPDPPPTPSNGFAYMQRLTTSDFALTYQWRKDDTPIPGASGPEYAIASMSSEDAGDYDVVIANDCGQTQSNAATLTLGQGVTIEEQPASQAVCIGSDVAFTVVAQGPDLAYQWRRDGQDISGAVGSTYAIGGAQLDDAAQYDVIVSNSCDVLTSAAAELIVAEGEPVIEEPPSAQMVCEGAEVTFTVVAEGTGLEYVWRKDGQEIDGATGSEYTIDAADPGDAGDYDVTVSSPCGAVTSDPATLTVDEALSITQQPAGNLICAGDGITLTVVTAGTGVSYQWRKNGEELPGATDDELTLADVIPEDSGDYDVIVSNICGEIVSDAAQVTVVSGPVIVEQPAGARIAEGEPLTLSVALDLCSFPNDVDAVGEPVDSSGGSNKIRGNSYAVTQATTLTRIEVYLNITTSGELVFFIYESGASEQGPYTLILEDVVTDSGTGVRYFASNPLEVPLEDGRYYIIGAAWRGAHGYYWEQDGHPQPTAFGESVHGFATSYLADLPVQPVPSSDNVYPQRLTTVRRDATYQWRRDGQAIPGATNDTYEVEAAERADSGLYDVVIENECGTVVSDPARVTVFVHGILGPSASEPVQTPAGSHEAQPRDPPP